jgi:redox-sensitive bicupin YhaK (pirin superfamily)
VTDGAGVRLRRSIASRALDHIDPFLLLDEFRSDDPDEHIPGFPLHPHRGIETVTYLLAGEVRHRDTLGNSGTLGPGDVQWMTAGRAIMHEEMPGHRDGRLMGFQLWVNLPAKDKMMPPRYQDVPAARIPQVQRGDGVTIRVITGTVDGVSGPVRGIIAEPIYLDVAISEATRFRQPVQRGHTVFAYVFEGAGTIGEGTGAKAVTSPQLVVFGDGDAVVVQTSNASMRFLLVSGAPIGEPIARYGPFVMNTWDEIQQTLRELREGTFVKP